MNPTTQEQLARWVAERLDIRREYYPHHWKPSEGSVTWYLPSLNHDQSNRMAWVAGIGQYWCSELEMLSDLNVAGRLRESIIRQHKEQGGFGLVSFALLWTNIWDDFSETIWDDTPSAILTLAEACGFTPLETEQQENTK